MIQQKGYSVADLYGSSSDESFSIHEDKEFSIYAAPDNTKTQMINKIAKGALTLCSLFWTALAGLSIEHFLLGSLPIIAGLATPWGIAILSTVGFLTITAYIAYALTSETGTC